MTTLFIPSPSSGVWYLGPLPLRGYALCIIAGIIAAIWIGERRWVGRGGLRGEVTDLALWAVPFGVVGGRIYHVITDHDLYFGAGNSPIQALYVWRGGLGIWGAIAFGAVGVYIGAKTKGIRVPPVLDAMAPGVLVAQAIGRWGNWFNQELFGKPSTQPWALKIDPENRPPGYEQFSTFQPTFLYECLWDLGAFGFVIWADRRFKLGHGRVLALYVMAYTAGRGWIEMLRIDDVEYQHVLGLRLNVWTSIVLFCLATTYFVVVGRKHPGRETEVYTEARLAKDRASAGGDGDRDGTETTPAMADAKGHGPGDDVGAAEPGETAQAASATGVATATMTAAAASAGSRATSGSTTEKEASATAAATESPTAKKTSPSSPKKASPAKKASATDSGTAKKASPAKKASATDSGTAKKASPSSAKKASVTKAATAKKAGATKKVASSTAKKTASAKKTAAPGKAATSKSAAAKKAATSRTAAAKKAATSKRAPAKQADEPPAAAPPVQDATQEADRATTEKSPNTSPDIPD